MVNRKKKVYEKNKGIWFVIINDKASKNTESSYLQ